MEEVNIVKRGETSVIVSFNRSVEGLRVTIKTHPSVEAFFHKLAGGKTSDVKGFGRLWSATQKDKPLMAYVLPKPFDSFTLDNGDVCSLEKVACPLLEVGGLKGDGRTSRTINLSFLKLEGSSNGAGITFGVNGVFTTEEVKQMCSKIAEGVRRFYATYLVPIGMDAIVSTQER